jgi:hypothetical protein
MSELRRFVDAYALRYPTKDPATVSKNVSKGVEKVLSQVVVV